MQLRVHLVVYLLALERPECLVQQVHRWSVVVQFAMVEALGEFEHQGGIYLRDVGVGGVGARHLRVDVMVVLLAFELLAEFVVPPYPFVVFEGALVAICAVHIDPLAMRYAVVVLHLENREDAGTLGHTPVMV